MRKKNGFTLIELLVVISIIVVLAGLLMPGIGKALKQAKTNRALSEMQHLSTVITQVYSEVGYYVRLEDLARTNGFTDVRRWIAGGYTDGLSDSDIPNANVLTAYLSALDVSAMWAGPYTTYKNFVTPAPTPTTAGSRPLDPWGTMGDANANKHQYRMFWITGPTTSVPAGQIQGAMVIISAGPDGAYNCDITPGYTPATATTTQFAAFDPTSTNKGDDVYYIFNAGIQ